MVSLDIELGAADQHDEIKFYDYYYDCYQYSRLSNKSIRGCEI